jgi:tRNA threonylcarbamoyladenosine biosynthesis protein TsaE
MVEISLADLSITSKFGRFLGERLFPGSIVALIGQLGAGKTHLSRAIAEGAGVRDSSVVTSPTFVLVQEYESGRLPIYHFDAYRLRGADEFADLGVAEYFASRGVCLIEWADRVSEQLPADRLQIELVVSGPATRLARIESTGPLHAFLVENCRQFNPDESDAARN